MNQTQANLAKALEILDGGKNWIRGELGRRGKYCAVGALNLARWGKERSLYSSYSPSPETEALYNALGEEPNLEWLRLYSADDAAHSLAEFNDEATGFGDVERVFKRAIEIAGESS